MSPGATDSQAGLAIVADTAGVRAAVAEARRGGRAVGFVPTMGALHRGHTSLIDAARRHGDYIVVSIYVNPTQFGPNEDYAAYPRTIDADQAACRQAGADLLFVPAPEQIYPPGDETRVRPGALAEALCGPFRPGHFEGVCTVVAKLLNIVGPDAAYLGQKDGQQALVIRRMVEDLRMPVRIVTCPIVREPDGLAMSSRNAYLKPAERQRALCLHRALCAGRDRLETGETSLIDVRAAMDDVIKAAGDVAVDYLSVVDAETLAVPDRPRGRLMIAGAVRIGSIRLIDNLLVDLPIERE